MLDAESIRSVLKQMDTDQSGTLDRKEMVEGLCKLGLSVDECASLVEAVDANGDGLISYDELVEFLPEMNSLLREEREENAKAEEYRKKRSTLEAKQRANAEAMERRILQKMKGITTNDVDDIKRALAKALLIIDELKVSHGETESKVAELEQLKQYKEDLRILHLARFPIP